MLASKSLLSEALQGSSFMLVKVLNWARVPFGPINVRLASVTPRCYFW